MEYIQYYLKLLAIPLFFLVLFLSLFIIWEIAGLPSAEALAKMVHVLFDEYGLPVVFLSSIIEGVLLIGNYFPGVFVIFLGVILSDSILEAVYVVSVVTIGLFIAHLFNYVLGRYGWYRLLVRFGMKNAVEQARERLVSRGPIAILFSYWLPNIGALTDTAAGIIHMPFKQFFVYSFISVILWDILAGALVYSFKDLALSIAAPTSGSKIVFVIIGIWIIIVFANDFYKKSKKQNPANL